MIRGRSCVRWFYYFYLLANIFFYKIIFFKSYSNYQISELNVKFDKLTWKVYKNCMKSKWKLYEKFVWKLCENLYENCMKICMKAVPNLDKIHTKFSYNFHWLFIQNLRDWDISNCKSFRLKVKLSVITPTKAYE